MTWKESQKLEKKFEKNKERFINQAVEITLNWMDWIDDEYVAIISALLNTVDYQRVDRAFTKFANGEVSLDDVRGVYEGLYRDIK